MKNEVLSLLSGEVLEEDVELTLADLCHACRLPAEQVCELVEEGVIEAVKREPGGWRFRGVSLQRIRIAQRLQRDLRVNLAGAALALDLLEELEQLRARLDRLDR